MLRELKLVIITQGKADGWDVKAHKVFIDVLNELDQHQLVLEELEG